MKRTKKTEHTTLVAGLLVMLLSGMAEARVMIQGSISNATGASSNILGPGDIEEPGLFNILTPRALLTLEEPWMISTIDYSFALQVYLRHSEATTYAHHLRWLGNFRPSPDFRISVGANASQGKQSNILLNSPADSTQVGAQPAGESTYVMAGGTGGISWTFAPRWFLEQQFTGQVYYPLSNEGGQELVDSMSLEDILGINRRFNTDVVGILHSFSYFANSNHEQQMINSLNGRWTHDYNYYWSSTIVAGLLMVMGMAEGEGQIWNPTGSAMVNYIRRRGWARLRFRHGAAAEIRLGNTFMQEEVSLNGGLPLIRGRTNRLTLSSTVAYQYGQEMLLQTGGLGDSIHVLLADASIFWAPLRTLFVGLRYQYAMQRTDANPDESPLVSDTRHTGMLTVTFTYPYDPYQVRVRTGGSMRSDGSDLGQ